MADIPTDPKGFSLRRWSQRKHAAARGGADRAAAPATAPDVAAVAATDDSGAHATTDPVSGLAAAGTAGAAPDGAAGATSTAAAVSERVPLPALDTLTIDSDYAPFMQPGVDDAVKRGALKKLFADPRFNVMDGLDVYIDDYSKPDPIDPAIVRTLVQARYIFNPPATRVNAQGHVEDVPDAPAADEANSEALPPANGTNSDAPSLTDGTSPDANAVETPAIAAIAPQASIQSAANPEALSADLPPVIDRL
jgi:hypothetical protein